MKLLEALAHMNDEKRLVAARIPEVRGQRGGKMVVVKPAVEIHKGQFEKAGAARGICLSALDIASDKWEIGWTCEACYGEGEVQVTCSRCRGTGMVNGDICCGGWDSKTCEGEEGKPCEGGIYWTKEY